jgi:hypothetical protein
MAQKVLRGRKTGREESHSLGRDREGKVSGKKEPARPRAPLPFL